MTFSDNSSAASKPALSLLSHDGEYSLVPDAIPRESAKQRAASGTIRQFLRQD
jgi:hypothetical protein